jgi:hypothetical protein
MEYKRGLDEPRLIKKEMFEVEYDDKVYYPSIEIAMTYGIPIKKYHKIT